MIEFVVVKTASVPLANFIANFERLIYRDSQWAR